MEAFLLVLLIAFMAMTYIIIFFAKGWHRPIEIRQKDLCNHGWLKHECPYCKRDR